MKRTTLMLDEAIYNRVKELGKIRGLSLKEVLTDLLRSSLQRVDTHKNRHSFKLPIHSNNGPVVGVDISDRESLYNFIDPPGFK